MTAGTLVPEALRLPAAPLLAAVGQAAHDRRTSVSDLLGKSGQKAYARARAAGTATLAQVEAVCDRLGCHKSIRPGELVGLVADVGPCCAGCCGSEWPRRLIFGWSPQLGLTDHEA